MKSVGEMIERVDVFTQGIADGVKSADGAWTAPPTLDVATLSAVQAIQEGVGGADTPEARQQRRAGFELFVAEGGLSRALRNR